MFDAKTTCVVVVGAQWGDEAKGKLVDVLASHVDVVVRYQGGNNAGHTVIVGREKFVFQSLPSGILRPDCRCVIGCGVVVDPASMIEEMEALVQRGVSLDGNLYICLLYTSPSPRDRQKSRMPSSA